VTAATVSERYFHELPQLKASLELWKDLVRRGADLFDVGALVDGRVKSHRSVLGKVYRRAKPRTWESLGDLVAIKAVFATQRGADQFTDWVNLQESWHPRLDVRRSDADRLSYQSYQYDLWSDQSVDSTGAPVKVELQVRTAAADAWYVVDHRLRYKGAVALPSDLERKLFRLIVLTELFDEEVEAVIERQASLPEYGVARLYESLVREVDEVIDGHAKASRPEGLLELVLSAYTDEEVAAVESVVGQFVDANRPKLREVVMGHLHESQAFVESRDWIYYEPEALLIAERALNRPALLKDRIRGSDFEEVLLAMVAEFQAGLA
jgi:ppGpp synthetase/RelA/SpoT-type nucleotidyltranferase